MSRVIVFDLNETLLDLSAMDPAFQQVFGAAEVRKLWFKQVLELFLTATVIDAYRPFSELTDAALEMIALQRGVRLTADDKARVHAAMQALPAHPDVRPSLERLKGAGLRLATLTNSGEKTARHHLEHAGLTELFDAVLSADAVQRYKPAREAYEYAAKQLDVKLRDIRLVAAHSWDVAGALRAGCEAAFVARPEKVLDPTGTQPEIVGRDLAEVADRILAADR
ncbi:MAG TPA: haloacid dehalogenase type II [Gaiellaceae bacterium]|nr:haloacid dehalogenase type II [Gaiellaceae bacterium]